MRTKIKVLLLMASIIGVTHMKASENRPFIALETEENSAPTMYPYANLATYERAKKGLLSETETIQAAVALATGNESVIANYWNVGIPGYSWQQMREDFRQHVGMTSGLGAPDDEYLVKIMQNLKFRPATGRVITYGIDKKTLKPKRFERNAYPGEKIGYAVVNGKSFDAISTGCLNMVGGDGPSVTSIPLPTPDVAEDMDTDETEQSQKQSGSQKVDITFSPKIEVTMPQPTPQPIPQQPMYIAVKEKSSSEGFRSNSPNWAEKVTAFGTIANVGLGIWHGVQLGKINNSLQRIDNSIWATAFQPVIINNQPPRGGGWQWFNNGGSTGFQGPSIPNNLNSGGIITSNGLGSGWSTSGNSTWIPNNGSGSGWSSTTTGGSVSASNPWGDFWDGQKR